MGTGRRIALILAAILVTILYWGVAWIHFFTLTFCHGGDFCRSTRAQRMADLYDAAIAWGIGYLLIAAACWALIRWRRTKK